VPANPGLVRARERLDYRHRQLEALLESLPDVHVLKLPHVANQHYGLPSDVLWEPARTPGRDATAMQEDITAKRNRRARPITPLKGRIAFVWPYATSDPMD